MWTRASRFLGSALCCFTLAAGGPPAAIDPGTASRYFHEAQVLGQREGGRLWGVPLYGPMLFVDGGSRAVIANGPDAQGALRQQGEVWEGRLPPGVGVSNTAMDWSGTHWTMVLWPLPSDRHGREKLLMHECFHRIQGHLSIQSQARPCGHLDTKEGRIWLQLEWRALGEALVSRGNAQHGAVQDALRFRAYRRSLFPEAAEAERDLELYEGLAEYTGIRASARSTAQAIADALVDLNHYAQMPTFVRSFAYASGPAYGLLLDAAAPGWRNRMHGRPDLGELLRKAMGLPAVPTGRATAFARAEAYGLRDLIQDETRREEGWMVRVAQARGSLVDGPVLILPRTKAFRYSFDPRNLMPLGDRGMVYPTLRATDSWGILEAAEGALMNEGDLRVPAPEAPQSRPLKGAGWSLDLTSGWGLAPGPRQGDFHLVPTPATATSPAPKDAQ